MTDWYEQAFGRDYLALYPHRDDAEARSDVAAIFRLIDPPASEPLLDLCCGAGRHLVALLEAGFTDLTGIDLSEHLLDVAQHRLGGSNSDRVRLIRADMRQIPFRSQFATILSLFTSFGYFNEPTEDEAVLHSVYDALRPGGTFLLDTLNRVRVIEDLEPLSERTIDSTHIRIERRISDNRRRVEKTIRIEGEGETPKVYHESVRMYAAEELHALLERARLIDVRLHGALDGRPHDATSPRLIAVARKPGEASAP